MPTPRTREQLEKRIADWAANRPDIRSIIIVGSRARAEHPTDEWSDLDLMLFTSNPESYVSSADWLEENGRVWLTLLNYTGRGDPEWLVLFAGGLKADFALVGAAGNLQQMIDQSPYHFVLQRGARVLVDKDGLRAPLVLPEPQPASLPARNEFLAAVHGFLLSVGRLARELKRGELWRAKVTCDCDLKGRLLEMLEWHARAAYNPERDTWYGGRFLEEWADPRAMEMLPTTFAAYDASDIQRALFATLDLFRWLAIETAERLGDAYPKLTDWLVTQWLESLFTESS